MEYTKEEIEIWKSKAEKWDELSNNISKCYGDYDDNGKELMTQYEKETGVEPDLITIGENGG